VTETSTATDENVDQRLDPSAPAQSTPPRSPSSARVVRVPSWVPAWLRSWARTLRPWTRSRGLLVVVAGFVVSRIAYFVAGVRFDAAAIDPTRIAGNQMQLLDARLLAHDLFTSLWYLNSQPPLYDLYCGLVLHLPRAAQVPVATWTFLLLGVVLAACAYLLLVELGVPAWLATAVALLFVVADPSAVVYENWLSWSYPAAALVTAGAYCCVRYLRTRRWPWGVACFSCFAAVVLDDSVFQIVWLLAVLVVVVIFMRRWWRQVLAVAAVPVLVVGAWCVKNAVLFGNPTTSTWLGMNLASTTVGPASHAQLEALVREGKLSKLVLVATFAPVGAYDPTFVRVRTHPGVAALDEGRKENGAVNLNNPVYQAASSRYLGNDLSYIEDEPGSYLKNVAVSAEIWFMPPDQDPFVGVNVRHIASYADLYDHVVLWQPQRANAWVWFFVVKSAIGPTPAMLSYLELIELALIAIGAPLMILRRRSGTKQHAQAGTVAVALVTIGYSFVVTSLVSMGEDERFHFELGALPLVVAVAVGTWLVRSATRREVVGRDPAVTSQEAGKGLPPAVLSAP
jgi:hypothetical protein